MTPFKTDKEQRLNDVYMMWLRSSRPTPQSIIARFKKDVEEIKIENPLYNEKSN
jgi:hypothetical protein